MSYTTLEKRWKKEREKKRKLEKLEDIKKEEKEIQFKHELYFASVRELKKMQEQEQKDKEIYIQECKNFLEYMSKNFPYRLYLIGWDICNNDYLQIEKDIYNKKITKEQVTEVYNIACQMITKVKLQLSLLRIV